MEPYILTADDIAQLTEQGFDTRGVAPGVEATADEAAALGATQPAPMPATAPDATTAAATGMPISMLEADGTRTAEPVGTGGVIAPPAAAPQMQTAAMGLLSGAMPTVAGGGFMGGMMGGDIQPQTTDPFEGLSRNQRMMLGFAALRDAAASLEGRDTNFFNEQLGTYESARERERLRVQGATQNRVQGLQALAQVQQQIATLRLLNADVPPGLLELERFFLGQFGGTAPMQTGGAAIPAPAPMGAPRVETQPVGGEARAPVAEAPTPASPDARLAEIDQTEQFLLNEMQRRSSAAAIGGGTPVTADIEARLEALRAERERVEAEIQNELTASQDAAAAAAGETRAQPLIGEALNFLVNDDGSINVMGARLAEAAPGVAGGQARLAASSIAELRSLAAMDSVQAAREGGYTGTLTDADIALIQQTGGTYDLSQPEATVRTLRRVAGQLSPQAQQELFGATGQTGGVFVPTDEQRSILEMYR